MMEFGRFRPDGSRKRILFGRVNDGIEGCAGVEQQLRMAMATSVLAKDSQFALGKRALAHHRCLERLQALIPPTIPDSQAAAALPTTAIDRSTGPE
jgi:hypothetical protein